MDHKMSMDKRMYSDLEAEVGFMRANTRARMDCPENLQEQALHDDGPQQDPFDMNMEADDFPRHGQECFYKGEAYLYDEFPDLWWSWTRWYWSKDLGWGQW